jgi:23S rRNA (adenine2030-N6)-methyltransferase
LFSYRHSFHAGNHGDVLKHICQMLIIEKLKNKDKGFVYIDTHSGAGLYQLDTAEAQLTAEYQQGISKVQAYDGDDPGIRAYQTLCAGYLETQQYPGSPEIARELLREQDQLQLMEWHNTEIINLKSNMRGANVATHHRDGFEGLIAITPPSLARGMVLIDPSYELVQDYQQVVDAVIRAHQRWAGGIYMIWYPLLTKRAQAKYGQSEFMLEKLSKAPFKNLLVAELLVEDPDKDTGMYGSGLAIVNAPWQLDTQLENTLAELSILLAQSPKAGYRLQWLIQE